MHNFAGPSLSSSVLAPRRKKLLFRAWHRGIKEMDIILGNFADANLAEMAEGDLDTFERLMDIPDRELFKWISGEAPIPENHRCDLLDRIICFYQN